MVPIIEAYVGEYASGKSENAVNRALELKRQGLAVTLVDLDTVEPCYTLRPIKQELEAAVGWVENFLDETRRYMFMLGAPDITGLRRVPIVITGKTAEWLTARGIDIRTFAVRGER